MDWNLRNADGEIPKGLIVDDLGELGLRFVDVELDHDRWCRLANVSGLSLARSAPRRLRRAGPLDGAAIYIGKTCTTCHGIDGNTTTKTDYPRLAGQSADYVQMLDLR